MAAAERGDATEGRRFFREAWDESTNDFEKFLAAHFLARSAESVRERLKWSETALESALKVDNEATRSALPTLYEDLAGCYEDLNDAMNARETRQLAASLSREPSDMGPFYHGTRADLAVGDLLTPGGTSNYKDALVMNHIYFTALPNGAGLAASLAKGDGPECVYIVEPSGPFENDPNVTDKKFPGNLTRSYRSLAPLKVVGEITDFAKQTPEQLRAWREKLANSKGEIIN